MDGGFGRPLGRRYLGRRHHELQRQDTIPGIDQNLHVVERFSRVDDRTLLYRFTIEDPDTWDRPWTGEYTWPATDQPIYEYACHEANYALGDILRGARTREAEAAARTSK